MGYIREPDFVRAVPSATNRKSPDTKLSVFDVILSDLSVVAMLIVMVFVLIRSRLSCSESLGESNALAALSISYYTAHPLSPATFHSSQTLALPQLGSLPPTNHRLGRTQYQTFARVDQRRICSVVQWQTLERNF